LNSLPKVAVCILNYNGESLLKKFLPSISEIAYPNVEIVVIDNESSDQSISFLEKNYPTFKVILNKQNFGFAKGYNEGLKFVEADYFVLLNNDVEVQPNFIDIIISEMEKDKLIAVAQPKIKSQRKKTHFEHAGACGGYIDYLAYPFCRGRIFNVIEKDTAQYEDPKEIFWASGCAFFIKSNLWFKFGGFDARFFAHMEEIDLCWRLKNAGYKNFVFPKSEVFHYGGATLSYQSPNKTYLNFRNNLLMLHKNRAKAKGYLLLFRMILDGVAAIVELLSLRPKHFFAVFKAHLFFYRHYFQSRKIRRATLNLVENEAQNKRNEVGVFKQSIVYNFFIRGRKKFSDLGGRV